MTPTRAATSSPLNTLTKTLSTSLGYRETRSSKKNYDSSSATSRNAF